MGTARPGVVRHPDADAQSFAEQTCQAIAETAWRLFAERGHDRVAVAEIARGGPGRRGHRVQLLPHQGRPPARARPGRLRRGPATTSLIAGDEPHGRLGCKEPAAEQDQPGQDQQDRQERAAGPSVAAAADPDDDLEEHREDQEGAQPGRDQPPAAGRQVPTAARDPPPASVRSRGRPPPPGPRRPRCRSGRSRSGPAARGRPW